MFLDRGRNRRDNELKTLRQKRRRIGRILEFGNKLRRRSVLAITGRDQRCNALVMRAGLVQFFVQPRRAGQRQRCEETNQNAKADAGARLHASRRFTLRTDLRKYFDASRERASIG